MSKEKNNLTAMVMLLLAISAYVTNLGSNIVGVVDTETHTVIDAITVGQNPLGITINGRFAYVANAGDSTVSVIDVVTNQVVDTVQTGTNSTPSFIAVNGYFAYVSLYTGDNNFGSVGVIDTRNNALMSVITDESLNGPQGLAVSGDELYVANWGASGSADGCTVSVIDMRLNAVTDVVVLEEDAAPRNIAIDGQYAYVANNGTHSISVIDTTNHALVATIADPSFDHPVAIAIDGQYAYVTNGNSNTISVIDTASRLVIKTLKVSDSKQVPYGIAINGNLAYVANEENNTVSVVDTIANTYSLVTDPSLILNGPAWVAAWVHQESSVKTDTSLEPLKGKGDSVAWMASAPLWVALFSTQSIEKLTEAYSMDRIRPIYEAGLSEARNKLIQANL